MKKKKKWFLAKWIAVFTGYEMGYVHQCECIG